MRKKVVSALLSIIMLTCLLPSHVLAADPEESLQTENLYTGMPPRVGYEPFVIGRGKDKAVVKESNPTLNATAADFPNNPPANVDTVTEKVAWIAQLCRQQGFADEWDIARWLHDWLIYNATYDYSYTNYHANGVLLKGTGVCQSYTEAYELLLDAFSIENQTVTSREMNHTWNLVKLNGQWCHVDCTWDDPAEGTWEDYYFFGMSDEMMSYSHSWTKSRYPAAPSKENYYLIHEGFPVAETPEEMELRFHEFFSARSGRFQCYYIGQDENYSLFDAFYDFVEEYDWKYGIDSAFGVTGYYAGAFPNSPVLYANEVIYTEPWEKPANFDSTHGHYYYSRMVSPTCGEEGYKLRYCLCGDSYKENPVAATGNHRFEDYKDTVCDVCGYERTVVAGIMPVYRLYNPYTYEHLMTSGDQEKYALLEAGWHLDGVAWNAPEEGAPVYRLYNPYDDWHTYTVDENEKNDMVAAGWKLDGVVSCSAPVNGRPIYRLFNPYVRTNFHLFTAGEEERDMLVEAGWILEGIAWYAVK